MTKEEAEGGTCERDGGDDWLDRARNIARIQAIRDDTENALCKKFEEAFTSLFQERDIPGSFSKEQIRDLSAAILGFVNEEFAEDLLTQSLPVLCASMRMIQAANEKEELNAKRVVELLNIVARDHIVNAETGVEVMGRIHELKISSVLYR